jgi:signal peptidase II
MGEVLAYARRASAAYADEAAIRAAVGPGPTLTVASLSGVDVRVFVEIDEAKGVQWVAVRGTANLQNAAEDADYTKVPARDLGIPVHAGFIDDARAVWSFVRPQLRPGLETRVTGHSLGGALAVLLAMRLRVDGLPVGHVITFGQPKVTTEEGVARFRDLPLLRVVNHDDPVPLLPWETPGAALGGFYRHQHLEPLATEPYYVWRPVWRMNYVENPGAAWGLFRGFSPGFRNFFFTLVSLGAVAFILVYYRRVAEDQRFLQVALAFVLAGAVGNFIDRLARRYVIDFVEWYWWNRPDVRWPTFNLADSLIVVGVAMLMLHPGPKKAAASPKEEAGAA